MEDNLKSFEKQIKKTHKFGFTPKYEAKFHTHLTEKAFIPIAQQAFEKLNWEIVYIDETKVEAKRGTENWGFPGYTYTELIQVTFEYGNVKVYSESIKSSFWDNGMNSKRVQLFILVFQQIESSYDNDSIKKLEIEQEKKNNWDNYEIPAALPLPEKVRKPLFFIPILGMTILSIVLGLILAKISIHGKYVIFLFEILVAIILTFVLKYLIKLSNYTNFNNLFYLLLASIFVTYFSSQYIQYELILRENDLDRIGFAAYLKIRLEYGLTIKTLKTGWIGLIISWILQLGFTSLIGYIRLARITIVYQIKRVPPEVSDFAYYHFLKGKDEYEVRNQLAKFGWIEEQHQNEVFESLGAHQDAVEMNRSA
ncbi:MAG: hypothetical protein BGO09_01835 [Bacteroidetes bacterium 47-18]|nr:MAG: hypothetical protein BGO09_01835 [Bacteroidetes bacterium 47-18]